MVLALSAIASLGGETGAARADERELGRYLAGQCAACHKRTGPANAIPPISAWNMETFVAIMMAYKRNDKTNTIMQAIAQSLSDEEISALAAYFGSLETVPGQDR